MPKTRPATRALDALASQPDVVRTEGRAGQVLVYAGHLPPGIFVVLEGGLIFDCERSGERRRAPASELGPFFTPIPSELSDPAGATVALAEASVLLVVPRSLVDTDSGVGELLREAGAIGLSLCASRRDAGGWHPDE